MKNRRRPREDESETRPKRRGKQFPALILFGIGMVFGVMALTACGGLYYFLIAESNLKIAAPNPIDKKYFAYVGKNANNIYLDNDPLKNRTGLANNSVSKTFSFMPQDQQTSCMWITTWNEVDHTPKKSLSFSMKAYHFRQPIDLASFTNNKRAWKSDVVNGKTVCRDLSIGNIYIQLAPDTILVGMIIGADTNSPVIAEIMNRINEPIPFDDEEWALIEQASGYRQAFQVTRNHTTATNAARLVVTGAIADGSVTTFIDARLFQTPEAAKTFLAEQKDLVALKMKNDKESNPKMKPSKNTFLVTGAKYIRLTQSDFSQFLK